MISFIYPDENNGGGVVNFFQKGDPTVVSHVDIGVKSKFWNLNFWLADIESTSYPVGHGIVLIFFLIPKMSFLELSKVTQIYTFCHFCSKMGKICH